jgi:hypothetical protein
MMCVFSGTPNRVRFVHRQRLKLCVHGTVFTFDADAPAGVVSNCVCSVSRAFAWVSVIKQARVVRRPVALLIETAGSRFRLLVNLRAQRHQPTTTPSDHTTFVSGQPLRRNAASPLPPPLTTQHNTTLSPHFAALSLPLLFHYFHSFTTRPRRLALPDPRVETGFCARAPEPPLAGIGRSLY